MPPIIIDSVTQQRAHWAVENQYGVLPTTPAWVRTPDLKILPKPQFDTEAVFGSGDELPSATIINDDYTNIDVSGKAGYETIMMPLSSMFGFATDAVVTGGTYDHTWTWDGRTPIIPASFAVHYGLLSRADEILGVIFNGLGMTVNRGGYDYSTAAFGKALSENVTMLGVTAERQTLTVTGAPTAFAPTLGFKGRTGSLVSGATFTAAQIQALLESIPSIGFGNVVVAGGPLPTTPITVDFVGKFTGQNVPILTTVGTTFTAGTAPTFVATETTPGADGTTSLGNRPIAPLHFDIFSGDSWAEIQAESTKLLALYSADMGWGDKWQRAMPVNSAKSSDGIFVGDSQEHTLNLRYGVDSTSKGLYATLRAGSKKYIRLHAKGPLTGDASNQYELVVDVALILKATDGYDSENGIHVITWNTQIARDEVLNNAVQIRVRNRRATL